MKTRNLFRALRSMIRSVSVSGADDLARRREGESEPAGESENSALDAPLVCVVSPVRPFADSAFIVVAAGSATSPVDQSSSRAGRLSFRRIGRYHGIQRR